MSDDGYGGRLEKRTVGRRCRCDRVLELLSGHRRRVVCRYMRDRPIATVEELATVVAEETGAPADRAGISLRHSDLPALSDAGVLEYDPRSATVRYEGHDVVEGVFEVVG